MCPIQRNLIDVSLLTVAELAWLNAYHEEVRAKLTPLLKETYASAYAYLVQATEPLEMKHGNVPCITQADL
jgi:Xaa-Pro aminopeptidase